jgi:FkbM family methyltransferase
LPTSVTKHHDLIFDVGMHRGEDTQHYLERGFRVVGVEANPVLVEEVAERFAREIAEGRLVVVDAAVAEHAGTVELFASGEVTVWTSLDEDFVWRQTQEWGTWYEPVEVRAVRFADLLREHGVPHYLKVDIEGSDMLCLRALHDVDARPDFLSIESVVTAPSPERDPVLNELAELWSLGYRAFKFIDQTSHGPRFPSESSGPFGEDTVGRWRPIMPTLVRGTALRFQYDVGHYLGRWGQTAVGRSIRKIQKDVLRRPFRWYDLHARLVPVDR